MENKKIYWWFAVPAITLAVIIGRLYAILPAVMQDEYVYSMDSRHTNFAEQSFPNYLFSLVYSSTNVCGDGFYSCAKTLNLFFFIGLLIFVYLISARLLSRGGAIAIVTLTILSPISVSMAFFMPEVMYFTFMIATVWFMLHAARNGKFTWWLYSGLMLGLTSLVKPHALFALPVLLVFAFFSAMRSESPNWKFGLRNSLSAVGLALATKFILGFLFAGTAGLTLFGAGYSGTLNSFASTTGGTTAVAEKADPVAKLFSVFGIQIGLHFSLLLLLWGIPLLLAFSVIRKFLFKNSEISELGSFVALAGGFVITYAIAVAAFEGLVTVLGDDHSGRVITRYYEFLLPLLLILAFILEKYLEPKIYTRVITFVLIVAAGIVVGFYFPANINAKFSDSVTVMGLTYYRGVLYTFLVVALAALIIWLAKPELGTKVLGKFVTPFLVVMMAFSVQASLVQKIGTQKAYFDLAGISAKPFLEGIDGSRIVIVGQVRTEVFTSKFWLDKPGVADILVGESAQLEFSKLKNYDYVIFLGANSVDNVGMTVTSGDRYVLIKVAH